VDFALIERLDDHARRRPDVVALREVGASGALRIVTWRELRDASCQLAERLRRAPEGVVAICTGNRAELAAALLGGLRADRAVLPLPPDGPAAERDELFRRLSVSVLVAERAVLEASAQVGERIPRDEIAPRGRAAGAVAPPAGAGSILLQSSGTTGLPKIVRRRAAALDAVGNACWLAIGVDESDAMLICIPLHHSYGIDLGLLTAVMAGCSVELQERFEPALARVALAERGISVLPGVPLIFHALARLSDRRAAAPRLRRAFSAGSPLARRVFDRFLQSHGVPLGQIYGATEFGSATWNDPEAEGFDPAQVGRPMRGVRLRIVEAQEPDLGLAAGEGRSSCGARPAARLPVGSEGQVAVSAPSLLSEYVGLDGAPTTEGFFLTGDLGRLDERGALTLTGRTKLLVDVGGRKVNPLEVESVLLRHPAVREAVAVAIPFSDTCLRLKAIVVPEPGRELSVDDLRRFAREHLSGYKIPRRFEIRTELPRSATGKILRQELA
jgi:acyl-CoA synthetase (AMP-forming)/AMP-acid ligase II